MAQTKTFKFDENSVDAADKWLTHEVEQLGKRAKRILYPARFAEDLGIYESPRDAKTGIHRGIPAEERTVVPYEVVTEYED